MYTLVEQMDLIRALLLGGTAREKENLLRFLDV